VKSATALVQNWIILALALCLIGFALLYQCFAERVIYFDEVGLFNPVYTYLHSGKMTYPAHGQFDAMFIHPPTQYFLIAMLMHFGLSVFHAAGLLSVLLFVAFAALVSFSEFPFPIKASLLFSCFLGAFVWNEALVLRPDLTLALCWCSGLVALESARLSHWNKWRLFVGGFFLALASAVHYPGIAAVLGLAVYAAWVWKALPWKEGKIKIGWMLGGACIIGFPYVVLFLIPHGRDVLAFSSSVQRVAPPGTAFQRHMEAYAYWKHWEPALLRLRPVVTILTEPIFRWSIPAAFLAPGLLILLPATRGLALASLPHLLFLLFGARHKQIGYTGYFVPEVILYLVAVTSIFLTAIFAAVQRLNRQSFTVLAVVIVGVALAVGAVTDTPAILGTNVIRTRGIYDFEAGRAAGRAILGSNAVVGTNSAGVWYTCGAAHLYFVTPEISYPSDLSCLDLKRYYGFFDALAVDPHQSWLAYSRQRVSITSSYLDGILQLRGFFFADRRSRFESGLSYMLYSVRRPQRLIGYGVRGNNAYRFEEYSGGDQVLLSAVCPVNATETGELNNDKLKLDFYVVHFRPIPSNQDPRSATDLNIPAAIVSLIADRNRFETDIRPNLKRCTVRDQILGRLNVLDEMQFIRDSDKTDAPMQFYPSFATFRTKVGALPGRSDLLKSNDTPVACKILTPTKVLTPTKILTPTVP
jgi:hypothetical protein